MHTFTLKANVNDLTGIDTARVTTVKIQTLPGPVSEIGGAHTTFEWETIKKISGGVLEVLLPQDATPDGYIFHVSFPQLEGMWWQVPPPDTADAVVWLSDYPAGGSLEAYQARPAIDHGDVSGTVHLSSAYGLHELNMTGDTVLIPEGPYIDMGVRVTGTGTLTLGGGAEWDTNELVIPGTMLFTHWLSAGWRAVAVAPIELIEVIPAGVTFTDSGLNIVVRVDPSQSGVRYLKDGVPIVFDGVNDRGFAAGLTNITWEPLFGYTFAAGHDTDHWTHTFGALAATPMDPVAIGNVLAYWNPNLSGAIVGTGLSMTIDDAGPNDLDLEQSGSVAAATATVNGKTGLQMDATTKTLRHLSAPAGQGLNKTNITVWMVVKMLNVDTTATLGLNFWTKNETTGNTRALQPSGPTTQPLQIPQVYANNEVLIMATTVPTSGTAKMWVSGQIQTGSTALAAAVHAFIGGGAANFIFLAGGSFDKILTDAEFASLRAWAQDATLGWLAT